MTDFLVFSSAALVDAQTVDAVSWSDAVEMAANSVLGSGTFVAVPVSEVHQATVETVLTPDSTVTPII